MLFNIPSEIQQNEEQQKQVAPCTFLKNGVS